MIRRISSSSLCFLVSLSLAALSGCSLAPGAASPLTPLAKATGVVHGGQQPITGATIQLYAVGASGYASAPTALISATITTSDGSGVANSNANAGNANNTLPIGDFTITGDYTCPSAGTLVYLLASGGNPGLTSGTNNSAILLASALGQCGSLTSSSFVSINEVTTVASVYALEEYSSKAGLIGAPSANATGIANAFGYVNDLVNISTGTALATDTAGNSVPQSTINTMANVLVPCVNSTGPTSTDCTNLFSTITCCGTLSTVYAAAYDMTTSPSSKVSQLYSLALANTAFQPTLSSAPSAWELVLGNSAESSCGYSGVGNFSGGTVSYSGAKTGRIYLALSNNCGGGSQGTSIAAAGSYDIGGVPPGSYQMSAFMDTLGTGVPNAADPTGSLTVSVPSGANSITLTDPSTVTLTTAPNLKSVAGFNTGVVALFKPIQSSGVEQASSYTLQWSTSSSFSSVTGSQSFPAVGSNTNAWFVNGLANGSVFYFRAYGTSAGTAVSPYSSTYGPVTVGAPSTGSAVSGTVTFTGTPTGPMYVGLYDQYSSIPYLQYIANPVSAQAYTVTVPVTATALYQMVALIDQNNNGVVDAGDIQNLNGSGSSITVTGPLSGAYQTLPGGSSTATVVTQSYSGGTYGFALAVNGVAKQPVAVQVLDSSNADGANVVGPMNIALCGQANSSCGQGFQISFNLNTTAPTIGDTYFFHVTYSDGTSGIITAAVTGVVNTFATSLSPTTGTSLTPTFSWACASCSGYVYQFNLNLTSSGSNIWSVPGNANGLPYTTTSLAWGVDPTDPGNTPGVTTLSNSVAYTWTVTLQDSNGNEATTTANYTP